jgi:hypothetical protein
MVFRGYMLQMMLARVVVTFRIDGTVSVNGGNGNKNAYVGGAGAGGGIELRCRTLAGSGGVFQANGGRSSPSGGLPYSGGGGGGRIAVRYDSLGASCAPRFSATHGMGIADGYQGAYLDSVWGEAAQDGTLYLSRTNLLTHVLTGARFRDVTLFVSGVTAWTVGSLVLSNCAVRFQDGFDLTVNGNTAATRRVRGTTRSRARTSSCSGPRPDRSS